MSDNAMALSRRFLGLSVDKRRLFLGQLQRQGLDLSALPIPSDVAGAVSPASYAQQRLWFIEQLEPGNPAYHLPGVLRLRGPLDRSALQQAFDTLARRHHSLRTRFQADEGGDPVQVVEPGIEVNIESLSARTDAEFEAQVRELARRPFDLTEAPLWRVALVRMGEQDHRLVLCLHHLIADGWSIQVLLSEFAQGYRAAVAGQAPELPPLPLQYPDVALWQRRALEAGAGEADLAYWQERLADEPPVLELPADHPRPARQSFRGGRHHFVLNDTLVQGLNALARAQGTTFFTVMLAAYKVLLHRLSGQTDLSVGVPVAGRERPELEGLIGFFVNTLVLRSELAADDRFESVLARERTLAREAQAHQAVPFEQLLDHLRPDRSLSHNPLFQVLYNHQQRDTESLELAPGLRAELLSLDTGAAQFDLALHTWTLANGQVGGNWNYALDLFEAETVARLHRGFEQLLRQIVAEPERAIGDYDLCTPEDRQRLRSWNATAVDYGTPEPVHRQFERQAAAHPEREALVFGEQRLSYGELDRAANRLAHALIEQGVGPDQLVGVAAQRSVALVVALYAIHKAGAAYVPIDPEHPPARQRQVLTDAGVRLVLSHDPVQSQLPAVAGVTVYNLDRWDLSSQPETAPAVRIHPQQRAYVIYTSGSTGRPKGVANSHAALYNRLQWMQAAYGLSADDAVLQKTPYSFDVSVWEFFWPLMTGARLVLAAPGEHRDPAALMARIEREGITTVHFVPSMLSAFLHQDDLSGCASLRRIVCSGEALPRELQDQTLRRLPQVELNNLYGPTEAAIDVSHWRCQPDGRASVPIGRPIGNLQIHILDERLNPQPIGVAGELYIGGAGLAQGYHGRPELTAERFVPNPFRPGERLYRSGDLARWCADGSVEYLGRLDHQIKLRGLRIELGEIESVLREAAGVTDAVVVARDGRLVGYVQSPAQTVSPEALRAGLKERLPEYMVPSQLMILAQFPLSANGKLDRKALPEPERETVAYEAPVGETEQALALLWQELLGVARVGRQDNFFALGGHSLLAVQLLHRVQARLGRTLPLGAVFETATLAGLARQLDAVPARGETIPRRRAADAWAPQSFAQQRLWFLAQLEPDSCAYHLPAGLTLEGTLDETALVRALTQLAQRHESLRTCFRHGDGGVPGQWLLPEPRVALERHDLRDQHDPEAALMARFQAFCRQPFDLEAAPPWRVALVREGETRWHLLVCMHHIISDGWSMQVLLEEWVSLYRSAVRGEACPLVPLPIQYADYAQWQRQWLTGPELQRQLDWWRAQLGDAQPTLELPTDRPRPVQRDGQGARHAFALPSDLADRLRALAQDRQTSLFSVILTGFEALLYRLSGQRDLRVGVPVAGRQHPGTERLIGFFVNTLVLRADIDPEHRVSDLLAQVHQRLQGAQAHAELPFEQLVEALQPERSLSHNPLFQVSYNHQVLDQRALADLPGLTCRPLACPADTAHFDLVLGTQEHADGRIEAYLDFATDLFEGETVARMAGQLLAILDQASREPATRLSDLPLLTEAERRTWAAWNRPPQPLPDDRPVPERIAEQARQRPEAVAVVHGAERISFGEFEARANRLAHWLRARGVGAEHRVGVALERGIPMLVALYAVHKAGAAYLPLDPDYPGERLRYMLEDAGARLLLSHGPALARLPSVPGVETVDLETLSLAAQPATAPAVRLHPEQLAYLIYTSGSTGRPKGVAVPHGPLAMHCQAIGARYGLTPEDRELHFLSISFDGAHERWLTALSHGTRLVLRDQALWSVQETYDCLMREGITVAAFPPSYLRQLAEWAELKGQPPGVRTYCFAGEAFSRQMLRHAIEHLRPEWIINGYGPTETVVTPTLWRVPAETADFDSAYAPIGDLVGARQGYVLDPDLNLLPPGVAGELYLGGALARGYLDRPGATAERFVPNPFRPGERLYRTGDRVRLNREGQLEYLGRMDQQVKLRGFRIEIGEVEAALKSYSGVKDALAAVKETGAGPRLVGYVSGDGLEERSLKAWLRERLPEYMVPSHLMVLERLPQLPNGKLDRNALPEPTAAPRTREAPRGDRECLLAEQWQAVLGVEQISREDSFFELGGDSIQSLGLITRLRQAGWRLTPKAVFLNPQLSAMAAVLEPLEEAAAVTATVARGELPLTPIQAHFFGQPMRDPSHWNQTLLFRIRRPLASRPLRAAVQALIDRHDALRLGFRRQPDGWCAFYRERESADRLLRVVNLERREDLEDTCAAAQRGFDLAEGPLAAVVLVNLPDGGQRLLLSAHHLIVDGVSWRILLEDLARAYSQAEAGKVPELGSPGARYQDWALHLHKAIRSGHWHAELDHWAALAEGLEAWPVDNPDGRNATIDASHCQWQLSAERTRRLLRETLAARSAGIDDLLLAALAEGLHRWAGLTQPLVAVEGHGREPVDETLDVSRTLGWFTSLYPLRLRATGDPETTFDAVRQIRSGVPGKGLGYGALRYLAEPEVRARLARVPEPLLAFNYLGQFDEALAGDRFELAEESPGEPVNPWTPLAREFEINGQIHQGRLTLSCRYSSQRYRRRTVQRLLDAVGRALDALIDATPARVEPVSGTRSVAPAGEPDPLVRLARGPASGPVLFCPHPVSGTVVGYYPLARRLSGHWQVWGMQNRQIVDSRWRDRSLAAMARDYVRALLKQQPQGPYHLLGWSMGGALALEMATLLERLGRTVAFVGLADGYVPGAGQPRAGEGPGPAPEGVGEDQWQQLLALEQHLRQLAREHHPPRPLKAPVHAWWASRSPESNDNAEALLAQAIGGPLASSTWLDTDHLGIVREARFLDQVAACLERLAPPVPEPSCE